MIQVAGPGRDGLPGRCADCGVQFGQLGAGVGVTQQLSLERLGGLEDCDVVLYLANAQGVVDRSTRAVVEQPLFQSLPAARSGRAVPLANYYATHYTRGQAVLDQVERILHTL